MAKFRIAVFSFFAVCIAIFLVGALIFPYLIRVTEKIYLQYQADENERRANQLAQFAGHRIDDGVDSEKLAQEIQSYLAGANTEKGYSCVVDQETTNFVCHPMLAAIGMSVAAKNADFATLDQGKMLPDRTPWEKVISNGFIGTGSLIYPGKDSEIVHMAIIPGTKWTISTHENTTLILKDLSNLRRGLLLGSLVIGILLAIPASFAARLVSSRHEAKVEKERQRSEKLLLNILPEPIALRLKNDEANIANHHENVTVLFADLSGFTEIAKVSSAEQIVGWLNRIFSSFDEICIEYGLEKIKTIGDAYMLAGGLDGGDATASAQRVISAGEAMIKALDQINTEYGQTQCRLRVGIHTGALVAGVIGKHKFSYDLWGDTVNMAARLESSGEVGSLHLSETTYSIVGKQNGGEQARVTNLKGIGEVNTVLVGPAT